MKTQLIFFILFVLLTGCSNPIESRKEAERFFANKEFENALIEINKTIDLEPDSIRHYSLRAVIYDFLGMYQNELKDLNKIIELEKIKTIGLYDIYHQRAIVKYNLGFYQEALIDIDHFINNRDTASYISEAYMNKAMILYGLNDLNNSEKYYKLAIKHNRKKDNSIESKALIGLSNLAKSSKETLALLNQSISICNNSSIAYGARGAHYLTLGKVDLAYKDFIKAISLDDFNETSFSCNLYFNTGQLFLNYINNNDSAISYFEKAIKIAPQSPLNSSSYMNIAIIKQQENKLDESLIAYEKGEQIDSKNDLLLYNFALLLFDLKRNKEALEKINRAILINSNDADYFDTKGTILSALSLFKEAEIEYKKAIALNPKSGFFYSSLGHLYADQLKYEESIKCYDEAVKLNYNLKSTLVKRALMKIELNKNVSACNDLKKALKLGRTDVKPLIERYCN